MSEQTLYERIGGKDAIKATVQKLYEKLLADESLKPFFQEIDVKQLERSQQAFLIMAFGGPHNYTGEGLRASHKDLVDNGLSDEHFDAVANHLQAALEELDVDTVLIKEVMRIVGTTKDDVLSK